MNPTIIVIALLFIILVSIQYTLNLILKEIRTVKKRQEWDEIKERERGDL